MLPFIPTEPIAKKKDRLFSDDFERADLGKDKGWAIVVPTYSLENGTLKGTQMRFDDPARRVPAEHSERTENQTTAQTHRLTFEVSGLESFFPSIPCVP